MPLPKNEQNTNDTAEDNIHDRQNDEPRPALVEIRNNPSVPRLDMLHVSESQNRIDNIPDTGSGSVKRDALENAEDDPDDI